MPPLAEKPAGLWSRSRRGAWLVLRLFSPFVLLLAGSLLVVGPEVVTRRGTRVRLDLLCVTYALGAALLGALLGALRPTIVRTRVGALLGGSVAILPMVAGIAITVDNGYRQWTLAHSVLTLSVALLLGSAAGLGAHRASQRRRWQQRPQRVTARVPPPAG